MTYPKALEKALRTFCRDHEASGYACEGLNAAYFEALAVLGDRKPSEAAQLTHRLGALMARVEVTHRGR